MRKSSLLMQSEFEEFGDAQLAVVFVGSLVSVFSAWVLFGSTSRAQRPHRKSVVIHTLSHMATLTFLWALTLFIVAAELLFFRISAYTRSNDDLFVVGETVISIFHASFEWGSWCASAVLFHSIQKQTKASPSARSKSLNTRQLLFIWGFPWALLVPTVVLRLFVDLGRINGVAITSLIHGVLLLAVVIWNFICFLRVSRSLRQALSTAKREMGSGLLVVQMSHKLQTSEIRTALLFVPFIISWTVPTYLSFSIAFSSDKEPDGVIWAFAILTPIYAFLNFIVYSYHNMRYVWSTFVGFCCRHPLPSNGSSVELRSVSMSQKKSKRISSKRSIEDVFDQNSSDYVALIDPDDMEVGEEEGEICSGECGEEDSVMGKTDS